MNLQEKLDFIDSEIRKLHMFCTKSGYSGSQIESFAQPFFDRDRYSFSTALWVSGKAWKRRAIALIVLVVAIFLLFKFDPAYNMVCAISKLGAIRILPLWDWTTIYYSSCLVQNPFYNSAKILQQSDCENCELIEGVIRASEVTSEDMMNYLNNHQLIIVEDGTWNWENASNITIPQLSEMYTSNPDLKPYYSCNFTSNIRTKSSDHMELFRMFDSGKLNRFYAQWENCHRKPAKVFRKIYKRPYFLPRAVALSSTNWLFISANYTSRMYKPVPSKHAALLFTQLKGDSFVRVRARDPCLEICPEFEETVHQGEILVVRSFVWEVEYIPSNSPENIAIVVEASYDIMW